MLARLATTSTRRVILWSFALWTLFPIYWIGKTSLQRPVDAIASPPVWLFVPTFANYAKVLGDRAVLGYFVNSTIVGLGATAIGLLFGLPTAYVLARFAFRGRADYDFWVLSTRMTPPVAMLIPFFIMYQRLGLQNTHLGLMLIHVSITLAVVIWVMKGFFADLPRELEEAALIDGCGYWQAFRHIVLPLALPGVAATAILCFLFSWNEFLFALVLGGRNVRTVPVGLYTFVGYQEVRWAELSAAAIVMLVPVLAFVLIFQRQLIRGLTLGAVRG